MNRILSCCRHALMLPLLCQRILVKTFGRDNEDKLTSNRLSNRWRAIFTSVPAIGFRRKSTWRLCKLGQQVKALTTDEHGSCYDKSGTGKLGGSVEFSCTASYGLFLQKIAKEAKEMVLAVGSLIERLCYLSVLLSGTFKSRNRDRHNSIKEPLLKGSTSDFKLSNRVF